MFNVFCTRPRRGPAPAVLFLAGALLLPAAAAPAPAQNSTPAHPVVPGYERFFTGDGADLVRGGLLLAGELNCASCHAAGDALGKVIATKQAPVLDEVGRRVRPGYLRKFLADPQGTKPGTTMPDLFAGVPEGERQQKVEALVHLLASTGSMAHERVNRGKVAKGRTLYNEVGCVACHGSRDVGGKEEVVLPTSVRLADLESKYSIPALAAFLANPHAVRPSGRMPGLLNDEEARDVANFLLQGLPAPPPNMKFAYYEGNWGELPDLAKLKPEYEGTINGIDLSVIRRGDQFALQFEGYFKADKDGEYTFFVTSDDGSRLWIDGKEVVNNDGVHAPATKPGRVRLEKGMHKFRAAMFEQGGGEELRVEVQGPGLSRRPADPLVYLTPEGNPEVTKKDDGGDAITILPALVQEGRKLFASMGCASCHQLQQGGQAIASELKAPPLAGLPPQGGCLAGTGKAGVPHYPLTKGQGASLGAFLAARAAPRMDTESVIAHAMTTLNCYACHDRGKVGGVEDGVNKWFTTNQPEMGEEGRIPPSLTGVGAKIAPGYFQSLFANGANDRPYMQTRMPKFGVENAGHLVAAFAEVDSLPEVPDVAFADVRDAKSEGRHIVGAKALGCIKCHTFAGKQAEGVQGIDMTLMTTRLKRDWFHQYLLDPNQFRPGTRMPTAWPEGMSPLPKVLGGNTDKQIEAIWLYLSDGKAARFPIGANANFIELIPTDGAIIYRNFISGAGSRAIGVGYPEAGNLAFDANETRLAMLWQGSFIDASRHWNDRGVGYQPPLGDKVLRLPEGAPFAKLTSRDQPWPGTSPKEMGYEFRGYRLTKDRRPTFLYSFGDVKVEDFPNAVDEKGEVKVTRSLKLSGQVPADLYYRAAVAAKIEPQGNGWYAVDDYRLRIESPAEPVIRSSGGRQELLVPVRGPGPIVQEYVW